jgi:DNA-binding winged helix-turn-helix (wHTH) protein
MEVVSPKRLYFGIHTIDRLRCSLLYGGKEVQLRPKAFDVLLYLAENAGRVVSKDELIKAVWRGVAVTDDSLVQCVMEIRQALGEDAQAAIRTVPRRGYLFAAEVSESEGRNGETGHAKPSVDPPKAQFRRLSAGMVGWLIAITALASWGVVHWLVASGTATGR